MKLSSVAIATICLTMGGNSNAFAPISRRTQHKYQDIVSSQQQNKPLYLFGGGNKSGDAGAKKGPGMLDQLAMFKKASEMAAKKNKLDQELAAETFEGTAADGKLTCKCKFVPTKNPMDPQPEYDIISFDFDDDWYESAAPNDLSDAVKAAVMDAIAKTNKAAEDKYLELQEVLKETMGVLGAAGGGGALPPEESS